ncbi:MAG TPA: ABC transporter substrate-binding protein [Rhizomicrobium sp.]|nr:ABC transporter substrate-binding protein [Rhizomicrobium sp.]
MTRLQFSPFSRLRAAMAAIIVAIVAFAASEPALASTPAEQFVSQNVQRGLTILNNHSIPEAQRRAEFRDFLTGLTDIRRIALFTLGAARRTASPAEIDAFVNSFRDYAVAVYESRLNQYSGQFLRVSGSSEVSPGDTVVQTLLVDPSGRSNGQEPIEVDFRVVQDNGHFVVIDVSIAGVWLGQEEREQFSSFLQQNNNNVEALTQHLQQLALQVRAGGGQPQQQR